MNHSDVARAITRTIVSLFLFLLLPVYAQSTARELVLLNWAEYLDPELVERFEQLHDVEINEVYFESDDLRDQMIVDTSGSAYDLAIVNGAMLNAYRKRGWLATATEEQVPNLGHVDAGRLNAYPGAAGYAIPYFWGTLGIAYRADLVESAPKSWLDLFNPAASVRGKIAMLSSQRDALGMALKALDYSANSSDGEQIGEAIELLLLQKPHVATYEYLVHDERSALVKGDVVMAMMFSGDALMAQTHHNDIRYIVPAEGGNIWTDYLVVMAGSRNKDIAYAFMDFLNEPGNAAQLAEFVYCATPNGAAEKLLPREFLDDPVIYPNEETLSKSEAYDALSPRTIRRRNTAFSRLMK